MKTLRLTALILALIGGLLFLDSSLLFAQDSPPPPTPVDTSLEALRARAKTEGSVRVIVGLNTGAPFQPEGAMPAAGAAAQQAAIATAQAALLQTAAIDKAAISARYKFVPYIALKLDAPALERLIQSGQAVTIQEDRLVPPTHIDWQMAVIGAYRLHSLTYDGDNSTVAIIDTGIQEDHGYFATPSNRVIQTDQACFSNAGGQGGGISLCPNGQPSQTGANSADAKSSGCMYGSYYLCQHGTHVAGIAAGNNGSVPGVAPHARILPVQVFTRFNSDAVCGPDSSPCILSFLSDEMSALDHIYNLRTTYSFAAVNMSLGGGRYATNCDDDALKPSIDNLLLADILTVISAGNSGYSQSVGAPGCISTAVTVGASNDGDQPASFSNRGPLLDLFAPGVNVISSVTGPDLWSQATLSGTSMAAPMVTGALADLREASPGSTASQLISALVGSTTSITYTSGGASISTPRLNLLSTYDTLTSTNSAPDTPFNPQPPHPTTSFQGTTLTWQSVDPDPGDTVTYTVYMDQNPSPTTLVCTTSTPLCTVTLGYGATYNWKVTATDNHGNSITGPQWQFTTSSSTAPPNDDISAAKVITSPTYTDTESVVNATRDTWDYPLCGLNASNTHSVWYRFTAPFNGRLTVDTIGSSYDTGLAIWTGIQHSLYLAACNNNLGGSSAQSRVSNFPVEINTTYYIEVVSANDLGGTLTLHSTFTQSANKPPYTPKNPTPVQGRKNAGITPTFIWSGGDPDLGDSVTYDVFLDTDPDPVTLVCDNATAATCTPAGALDDNTLYYWKVVAGDDHGGSTSGRVWNFITGTLPAPDNDDFDFATPIAAAPFTDTGFIVGGATTAGDDPSISCAAGPGYETVWYSYTPPQNGLLTIDTRASTYDSVIAVWTGARGSLTALGCNDDEVLGTIVTSRMVDQPVVGGTPVYIEVAALYDEGALLNLNLSFHPTSVVSPMLKSPKNGSAVIKQPVKLAWKAPKSPLNFHIQVNSQPDFNGASYADQDTNSKKPKFSISGLPFGVYYWRVRALTSLGDSAYSAPFSFEVTALKAPKKGAIKQKTTPKFAWQATRGASYELQVFTNNTDDVSIRDSTILYVPVTKSSYPVLKTAPLSPATTYYWRVRVNGQWTPTWSFTTK